MATFHGTTFTFNIQQIVFSDSGMAFPAPPSHGPSSAHGRNSARTRSQRSREAGGPSGGNAEPGPATEPAETQVQDVQDVQEEQDVQDVQDQNGAGPEEESA